MDWSGPRQQGKTLGPPRKLRPGQVEAIRGMREEGASLRRIASDFECSASTVLRALRREGVASMNVISTPVLQSWLAW